MLNTKDLIEMCDIITELSFTYKEPGNDEYYDFFMLLKNLFDAINLYTYNTFSLVKIGEFYTFIYTFINVKVNVHEGLSSRRLIARIGELMEVIRRALLERNAFEGMERGAITRVPRIEEKDKTEWDMKQWMFRQGSFTNICLRTQITMDHELIQALLSLLDIMRRGIYGSEGLEGMKKPFTQFRKKWRAIARKYKGIKDFSITPIIMDVPETLSKISQLLDL